MILIIFFILSLIYQIKFLIKNNPQTCLKAFKLNNFSGLILFFGILGSLKNFIYNETK